MIKNYKDFYTIAEFAEKLSVHSNTIRRAIKRGKILAVKFGTEKKPTYRIPHTEIDRIAMYDLKNVYKELLKNEKLSDMETYLGGK